MNWMKQMAKCIQNRKKGETLDEVLKRCAAIRKKTIKNTSKRSKGTQKQIRNRK